MPELIPARSVGEPEKDKVLRGSKDGFVETIVFNTALIRRRIRSTQLRMEMLQAGKTSHTDIVLCYMEDRVDQQFLEKIREPDSEPAGGCADTEPGKPCGVPVSGTLVESVSKVPIF